jgi:hypothetical protein
LFGDMGFFARFTKKPFPDTRPAASSPEAEEEAEENATEDVSAAPSAGGGVMAMLADARAKLDKKDLPGALALYEEALGWAGDRADVLVTISGDLGSTGNIVEIVELIAPRYDAERHGPATGLNLLQAYLSLRQPEAAQHVLDILFALKRPELEEQLHGFSNALAELLTTQMNQAQGASSAAVAKVALVTISKPVWFYGLEDLAPQILPTKEGPLRRIAFAQLALPGAYKDPAAAMKAPEDELGRLSRALPLWLAETFYFSTLYLPAAAIGIMDSPTDGKSHMIFAGEWTLENLKQLVDTATEGFDYIVTGALRQTSGDFELLLRVWEVKKFRERKQFTARWTPATANAELAKLQANLRVYMEWAPAAAKLTYVPPTTPKPWLDMLGFSLDLFLLGKKLLPTALIPPLTPALEAFAPEVANSAMHSLAWLTLLRRAREHGLNPPIMELQLSFNPIVGKAAELLGSPSSHPFAG